MFNIEFIADEPEAQEDGGVGLWGRTTLGEYQERFIAPLGFWSRADYERQWLEAARRLLGPADRTGFFTSAYQFWWTMWREGERVWVHEELITAERYAGPYDGPMPYHLIGDRVTVPEGERPVSEWVIGLDDIQAYVERREASRFPA
jgi:hypothetical protein